MNTCYICKRSYNIHKSPHGCPSCFPDNRTAGYSPVGDMLMAASKYQSITTFLRNKIHRPIGVELEIIDRGGRMITDDEEGQHYASPFMTQLDKYHLKGDDLMDRYWRAVRDGSVTGGREFVSPPIIGDEVLGVLAHAASAIADHGVTVDRTCGYHVHVGATRDNFTSLRNLFWLYLTLEAQIYKLLCRADRVTLDTCRPFCGPAKIFHHINESWLSDMTYTFRSEIDLKGVSLSDPDMLLRLTTPKQIANYFLYLTTGVFKYSKLDEITVRNEFINLFRDKRGVRNHKIAHNMRYTGLNIWSYFYRGTVEWRMKEGITTRGPLIAWPLFCLYFTHVGMTVPLTALVSIKTLSDLIKIGTDHKITPNKNMIAWLNRRKSLTDNLERETD